MTSSRAAWGLVIQTVPLDEADDVWNDLQVACDTSVVDIHSLTLTRRTHEWFMLSIKIDHLYQSRDL